MARAVLEGYVLPASSRAVSVRFRVFGVVVAAGSTFLICPRAGHATILATTTATNQNIDRSRGCGRRFKMEASQVTNADRLGHVAAVQHIVVARPGVFATLDLGGELRVWSTAGVFRAPSREGSGRRIFPEGNGRRMLEAETATLRAALAERDARNVQLIESG